MNSQPDGIGYYLNRNGGLSRLAWYRDANLSRILQHCHVARDGGMIRIVTLVATHDPSLLTYPTPANDARSHPRPA